MTIKTRNRLNVSLFFFSLFFLAVNVAILLISLYKYPYLLMPDASALTGKNILTQDNPLIVLISLFFQIIYVCITSFMLYRVFEKTQATDISFFFLFLVALLTNSFRIWILLFSMANTYSNLLIFCGNTVLFSKLLVPVSLFFSVAKSSVDQRQDLEKNIFILLLGCIFFSQIIPLNTANICINFEVDYSFRNVIRISSMLILLATLIALFFNNKSRYYTQLTTIGLALICTGTIILLNCTNILKLILSFVFLLTGNIMYLKELHKQYLWNDV